MPTVTPNASIHSCLCNGRGFWFIQRCFSSSSDPDVARDVLQLIRSLRLISDTVSVEMAYEMEKALEYRQPPGRAAELVLENMLCNDK